MGLSEKSKEVSVKVLQKGVRRRDANQDKKGRNDLVKPKNPVITTTNLFIERDISYTVKHLKP